MNKLETYKGLSSQALDVLKDRGQTEVTKHDILLAMQELDATVKDGEAVGLAIYELEQTGQMTLHHKRGNANVYRID